MGIPDSQLQTWTNLGSVTQSSTTYATIKGALTAPDTGYAGKSVKVFLQGSYCNDTNVWADSDVDIVIRLDSVFHFDLSLITPTEAAAFHTANPGSASYTYDAFKADVMKALSKRFGAAAITAGEKAIKIKADGGRRSADVVVATQFKRYRKFPPSADEVDIGVCIFTKAGIRIANYPEQHSKFCTAKHQSTNSRFKPMVRIFKNMRNKLVNDEVLADGVAPSYYLEGLVYNAPDDTFAKSALNISFPAVFQWIFEADRSKFVCPNYQYFLFGDSPVQWSMQNCDLFLKKVADLWNTWA
jgi:hypothetical protein